MTRVRSSILAMATTLWVAAIAHGATPEEGVQVINARDLAGRELLDPDGKELGTVRYVLVRIGTGEVRGVAVREKDGDREGLVLVPTADLQISVTDDEVRTRVAADQLRKAPHFSKDSLARLTEPTRWTTVEEYWAPLRVDVASGPPKQAETAPKPGRAADAAEGPVPHILVGRTVVTTLASPDVNFARQIRGADVYSREGELLGEIDDIVLEPAAGRVAYAVIAQGGFLGMGTEWYAVPVETLQWVGKEQRLRFEGAPQRLKEFKSLDASRAPMRIRRSDLTKLYERFGAEAYWQKADAS